MANVMTYRTLLRLLQGMDDMELDSVVMSHNNEYGIWCYPHGILVEVGDDDELQVVLDDGLIESAQGQINREV